MAKPDDADLVEDIMIATRIHKKANTLLEAKLKDAGGISASAWFRKLLYTDLGLIKEKR